MKIFKKNKNILGKCPPRNEREYLEQLFELSELKWEKTLALLDKNLSYEELYQEVNTCPELYCIKITKV